MQIISKDGIVKCRAAVHYTKEIVQNMKAAGYEVKEIRKPPVSGSDTRKQ